VALQTNNSLKILNLSDNKIDDKGFKSFGDVPYKNHSLEDIDLSRNMISVK
jgi:Leucine-rich repeat (LRR) protein